MYASPLRAVWWKFVWLWALLLNLPLPAEAARQEMDLSGTWQYQKVAQLVYPPSNSWQTITVPSFLSGWQYEHAWYRDVFTPPGNFAGTNVKLHFGGVKFNAQIWLNGRFVGSYLNGYEPFELDVTSALVASQPNELIVGVTDWTATFSTNVDFSGKPAYEDARNYVSNTLLAPIGGRYDLYGIWQSAKLISVPAVSIADVFVIPSVRTQQLTAQITLRNDSSSIQIVTVTNRVLDGAAVALTLPLKQIAVPPGTNTFEVSAPWTNPHWWTQSSPYLYRLETTAVTGAAQDQVSTRFGFREFWTANGQFFLNGIPINLLATATWPPTDLQNTNQIALTLANVKAGNNVAMRLHTQPWDEPWYDLADELGLLIVEECAVWCDPAAYRLSDPAFWTNYGQHLTAAVKRDRNHPSIVLWSLENEILHCGGERVYSATDTQLAAMGRLVKGLDPTRPITYEADLDPAGEADVLGLHYPHEFPDYQVWPNAAWWMDQPIPKDWMPGGQWKWDHTKPLYVGEFLWIPPTSTSCFTILYGDDAYNDPMGYRNLAKGLAWKMQIEAFRAYGVNGISPWTLFEDPAVTWGQFDLMTNQNYLYQVQQSAYQPNYVFAEEYNPRFFSGSTVQRTVHIFNDRPGTNNLTLSWSVAGGQPQTRSFVLPPAGQKVDTISFQAPGPGPFALELELATPTGAVFSNSLAFSAFAPSSLALPRSTKLALYDPRGTTAGLMARFNVPFNSVTNLRTASYADFNVLLIGRDALTNEPTVEVGPGSLLAQWQNFARQGGWVVLLEQTNYPAWIPVQLQAYDASFAFPNSHHPITQGLTSDQLRWWAGDHRVVNKAFAAPARGNFRVLAGIGATNGMEYAAAIELPLGKGGLLCSQWPITQKYDIEPMAGILLQRILNYCTPGGGHPELTPIALAAETNSTVSALLGTLGLKAENFFGRITNCDPAVYPVLFVGGGAAEWQEAAGAINSLVSYVSRGGTLLLHRPTDAFLAAARPLLGTGLDFNNGNAGPIFRREITNAAVQIGNHDLYWIAQAGTWNQPEVLSSNIAYRTYHPRFDLTTYATIFATNMPSHTSGGPGDGGWWLWSNGSVAQSISVTQGGTYLFHVSAKGTPLGGVWPHMTLQIDNRAMDSVFVATNQESFFTLSADLSAGLHQMALMFDNDEYAPPEDRNLFVNRIQWGRAADNAPSAVLTRPGAVAQTRIGSGVVLFDEIAWDTETQSVTKAMRFASSLLTGVGALMEQPAALHVEAETMTNVNVAAYGVSDGLAWLNSNGRIETTVRFTTTAAYTFDVAAGGNAAVGVLPQIGITVDGVSRTNFFLVSTNLTHYLVALSITAGAHAIGLAFLNDYYAPPADRNAFFDGVTITPPANPRFTGFDVNPASHLATLQWESTPGRPCELQMASHLSPPDWRVLTNISPAGSVTSWLDDGQLSGIPPFAPGAPTRFYRLRQLGL